MNSARPLHDSNLPGTFGALADPTRLAIIEKLLADGEQSVTALAEPFSISLPAISKHLKVLEDAGLLARRADHRWRYVSVRPEAIAGIDRWVERYRRFWESSFDRLGKFLTEPDAAANPKESDNG
jgi:DNA-binding transcriptional ArsR family regulator